MNQLVEMHADLTRLGFSCPPRRKLLVFINPFSGTGRALKKWKVVKEVLLEAGLCVDEVVTKQRNHALNQIKDMSLDDYSGVVIVSGDGLIHEVLNGLCAREDWQRISSSFPLAMVPGGSGNAIHCSLLHQQNEDFRDELLVSGLNIARGELTAGDYIECRTEERSFCSMFGVAWGLIPDCDLSSETIRWAGFMRVYPWLLSRILKPSFYKGTVHYLPVHKELDSPEMPEINQPVPDTWTSITGEFLTVYACRQSWLDYSTPFIPRAKLSDGCIHLMIATTKSRLNIVRCLLDTTSMSQIRNSGVLIIPVSAFRFEIEKPGDPLTVDAEALHCTRVQQGRIVTA